MKTKSRGLMNITEWRTEISMMYIDYVMKIYWSITQRLNLNLVFNQLLGT